MVSFSLAARAAAVAIPLAALSPAQNLCEGNGVGSAFVSTTPAVIGGTLHIMCGSPAAPLGLGALSFSSGLGPQTHPVVGPTCLDFTGFYLPLLALFDATGTAHFHITVPNDPGTIAYVPLYVNGVALEGSTFSVSKTSRVQWEFADSWRELPAMNEARALHTATALGAGPRDNRTGAFVAGGGQGSLIAPVPSARTQVFDALRRTWTPGPNMAFARTMHRAVRLPNGRILVSGGVTPSAVPTDTGGPTTRHCEIYDPTTNTFTPTGQMNVPRSGHGLTLLADGRVLASGGLADWTNAGPNFLARCQTGTATTEIYDPATGVWTPGPTMASVRSGHTATRLTDGRVLVVGGMDGAVSITIQGSTHPHEIPTFTISCEVFDPTTNTFTPTASLGPARGFHGASLLANGAVLVTGGAARIGPYTEAAATNSCSLWSPATGLWTAAAPLLAPVAFHDQIAHPRTGEALLFGGFLGNFQSLVGSSSLQSHTGGVPAASASLLAGIGSHPTFTSQTPLEVGTTAAVLLHDETVLLCGGYSSFVLGSSQLSDRALLYVLP